jgi:hypothetical protein
MISEECQNNKVDQDRDEVSLGEERHARFLQIGVSLWNARRSFGELNEIVREVEAPKILAHHRHDEVIDQRVNDLAEGGANITPTAKSMTLPFSANSLNSDLKLIVAPL